MWIHRANFLNQSQVALVQTQLLFSITLPLHGVDGGLLVLRSRQVTINKQELILQDDFSIFQIFKL